MRVQLSIYTAVAVLACTFAHGISGIDDQLPVVQRQDVARCGGFCKFRLCQISTLLPGTVGGRILIRPPQTPIGPFLCLPKRGGTRALPLMNVVSSEALVTPALRNPGRYVRISRYRPSGLTDRYPRNFFGFFPMPPLGLGVAPNATSVGNQFELAHDICVRLPVRQYQLRNRRGELSRVFQSQRRKSCVEFWTVSPQVLVTVSWNNNDDLDIVLAGPGGLLMNRFNPFAASCRLITDAGGLGCRDSGVILREDIRCLYPVTMPSGEYELTVIRFDRCVPTPVEFTIDIVIEGVIVQQIQGSSDVDSGETIGTFKFNLDL